MDGLVTTDMGLTSLHNSEREEAANSSRKQEVAAVDFSLDGNL